MAKTDDGNAKAREYSKEDDARRRADGEAFDNRMKEFSADAPRAARSDPERRRKR